MNIVTFKGNKYPLPTKLLTIDRKFRLEDGVNYFEDEEFLELEKSKPYQQGLIQEYITVIKPQDKKKVANKARSPKKILISELSLEDAKIISASETDKKKSESWLKEEKANQNRKEVIAILEQNLKKGKIL